MQANTPSVQRELEIPKELLQLLMQVGYVATGCSMAFKAKDIFEGLQAVRPNSEEVTIATAISMFFSLGKFKEPAEMLIKLINKNPSNDLAKSFLALMFKAGNLIKESETIANEVIKNNTNKEAVALAKSILEDNKKTAA
ncbi:MAG: hypothetical protein A2007_02025 [Verrucomicrobia bacterium GWC2_42_7]|nr:MAG: hypothetical protein A2007_02025 [Verrucomicrobia bacterium GWC2_42_7]